MMKGVLQERVKLIGLYISETGATVREAGKVFGVSKSTVHLDVSKRLKKIDANLFKKVVKILEKNFNEKHIRGGISTKNKFLEIK